MSTFKKLRGRKVLVNMPVIEKSVIELGPEVQAELDKETMKKWTRLEVFAVGDLIEDIAVGDKVYIPTGALGNAERISFQDDVKFLVDDYQINIVW